MMAGAGRELAITHLAQRAAESLLGDGDTKFLENPLAEINNPPAHHPMDRRNRPALEDCGQRRVMSVVQPRRLSRSFAIDQPFRSFITQSRTTCNPTPPIFAASVRVAPS
jgi:hypothetical protein